MFRTIVKLLEFDRKYRNVFRDVGLFDVILKSIRRFKGVCNVYAAECVYLCVFCVIPGAHVYICLCMHVVQHVCYCPLNTRITLLSCAAGSGRCCLGVTGRMRGSAECNH